MQIALIGAGNIGRALTQDILDSEPQAHILAVDFDPAALDRIQALDPQRIRTLKASSDDTELIEHAMQGAAVVVNCTYGAKCMEILDAAIRTQTHYIDVHGTLLMEERFSRSEAAKAAGITALIGAGVSPGLTNMLAAWGARQFKEDVSPIYIDRKLQYLPPFSGEIKTRFHGVDEEVSLVYTPHSEPQTIPRFVANARNVSVRGSYQSSIMTLIKSLYAFGLMDPQRRVTVDGKQVDFAPLLREALHGDGSPKPSGVTTNYVMRVRVVGEAGVVEVSMGHPKGWDPLPQARMTALQPAYAARLIATGAFAHPGVVGTEMFTDAQVEGCLAHLQSRGLWLERSRSL
jgi:saccharopine dehydrogenase-like NADP-dependent oxidoreductase